MSVDPASATETSNPDYYHRVVDCQWACPAHTDVPEYIRLIAQGRYTDAYVLNRDSNVFPGILGRVCDRPCEPACRRSRVEDKPVAICRLKRVAADLKGELTGRLPRAPAQLNGKRIACIGAGPASLTVANDLAPLGYDVTIFEQNAEPGGLMRTNIPSFRLPQAVLDEEIGMILDMGVTLKLAHPIQSMRALLADGGYDAVFVGGDSAQGPKNIIWAVEQGHQAALSMHLFCHGESVNSRPESSMKLSSRKMGMHEWSYKNDYAPLERRLMPHVSLKERFKKLNIEVELGFTPEQAAQEAARCLNCDVQTVFEAKLCIECDACIDICPVDCLTITQAGTEQELRTRLRAQFLFSTCLRDG